MELNVNTSVGEIVRVNYKTAHIFDQHRIDFCCGGDKTLHEACSTARVDEEALLSTLRYIMQETDSDSRYFENLSADLLCNYIVERHHDYINENVPFIQKKLQKLCDVHGRNHPEIHDIKKLFDASAANLSMHMKKEELMLFPYIKRLVKAKNEGKPIEAPYFGNIRNPVSSMVAEHQEEGLRFIRIAKMTDEYTIPPDGCNTYQVTYQSLHDFEMDLHRHIHLENNILFPKAAELEKGVIMH
jgi:regulator of cell morphogenesis and NO signaling